MRRIGVLASGMGTNLQALIEAQARGQLGAAGITLVLSNVGNAPALARAGGSGIAARFVDPVGRTRAEHEAALLAELRAHEIDLLCLAGYMRRLTSAFIDEFPHPILNIHPSLLPSFPGLDAQRQAWEYGVKVSGATVHLVDGGLDSGPIVLQEALEVRADDTPDSLTARIRAIEHRIYPRAVRHVVDGRYVIEGRRVVLEG